MKTMPTLREGSKVALVATARHVDVADIDAAAAWLRLHGLVPVFDERLFAADHIFAGSDAFRAAVFQSYLDRPDIDAIWFARGGYGSVRIVDRLDFGGLRESPKLLAGFSDTTVFHATMQSMGCESLHACMPYQFGSKSEASKQSLLDAFFGKGLRYELAPDGLNRPGRAEAEVVGGNLSVLYGLLGSDSFPDTRGKILFLEEVDEYVYHVERMMTGLRRAGKLSGIAALLVGGLTAMHDNPEPFGKTAEQVMLDATAQCGCPVCFGFPAGHGADNRALVMGRKARLDVGAACVSFRQ